MTLRRMSLWRLRALLVTDPLIVLATLVLSITAVIVSLFDATGRAPNAVARAWGRVLLWVSGVKVRLEGVEKIAPEASYVFASNHLSYMDIPALLAGLPAQIRFLAKKGVFRVPLLGFSMKRAGYIPVPREDTRASLKTLSQSARLLKQRGVSVLVFPEGGRSPGAMRDFKPGASYLAIKAGVPVVPVGLVGTREVLPMDSLLVRGHPVILRIGDPIPTDGMRVHDHEILTRQLYERVAALAAGAYQ